VALVYFAGHGATFGDIPYVVPMPLPNFRNPNHLQRLIDDGLGATTMKRILAVLVLVVAQASLPTAPVMASFASDQKTCNEPTVRVAIGETETIFGAPEDNGRMRDKAAHACHALCRARVVEEIRRRRSTTTAEHLKLVLSHHR
jgi:hypothetical protein